MTHGRADYERIQDPEGRIGADEPVFLMRAQDLSAPHVLMQYAAKALEYGAKDDIILGAVRQALAMREYQFRHPPRTPDL